MISVCRHRVVGILAPAVGLLVVSAAATAQGVTGAATHGRVVTPDSAPVAEAVVLVTTRVNRPVDSRLTAG